MIYDSCKTFCTTLRHLINSFLMNVFLTAELSTPEDCSRGFFPLITSKCIIRNPADPRTAGEWFFSSFINGNFNDFEFQLNNVRCLLQIVPFAVEMKNNFRNFPPRHREKICVVTQTISRIFIEALDSSTIGFLFRLALLCVGMKLKRIFRRCQQFN